LQSISRIKTGLREIEQQFGIIAAGGEALLCASHRAFVVCQRIELRA